MSVALDYPIAAASAVEQITPADDRCVIGEAATHSEEKEKTVVKTERSMKDLSDTNQHSYSSDTSESTPKKQNEACSRGSAQEVVSSNKNTCSSPSLKNAASDSLLVPNGKSDQNGKKSVNHECESERNHLPDRAGDKKKDSKGVSRCKLRLEMAVVCTFFILIVTRDDDLQERMISCLSSILGLGFCGSLLFINRIILYKYTTFL